jgi:hypothetical protein
MKLIQRTTLLFQAGASDKVYEVDLCEVGANAYVINFRYGRRGAALKEGSKTVSAVPLVEAQKIVAALLAEKTKKGYRAASAAAVNAAPIPVKALKAAGDANARAQAVLQRLRAPKDKSKWPLNRAIWRAGELKISAAAPLLVNLIGSGDGLRDYCLAWSLGWCGDEQFVSALGLIANDAARPLYVRRIAREAIRKLLPRSQDETALFNQLPPGLRATAERGPAEKFAQLLHDYLASDERERMQVLETIYQIDNEHVRPALLDFIRTAPLRPNTFQQLRYLFKTAEYRRDAEVFGWLAYRFEKGRAMYGTWYDNPRSKEVSVYGTTVYGPKSEKIKPDTKFAYSDRTRRYLRQRVWRTLRRLGEINDADYVKMAVGVLLPYTDGDAQEPRESTYYRFDEENWQRQVRDRVRWDRFAAYVPFNHILYLNSPRYQLKPNTIAWRCRKGYKPGDPEPPVREEAFPRLWEAQPVGLLHLLAESNCQLVHQFAVKALRACGEFCQQLDNSAVVMLLTRPYEMTAKLGFELAEARYDANAPDLNLALAVAECQFAEARAVGYRWIAEGRQHFLRASGFLANLVTSEHADTREFARKLLQSSELDADTTRTLIVRLMAFILVLDRDQETLAREIATTLQACFAPQLRSVGMEVLRDLLDHPLLAAQELGGFILLNHETPADQLPETIIHSLIASPHEVMRGIGIKLFGQWPDARLLQNEALLMTFATHELADLRQAIRPVIRRLSQSHADFAARMAASLFTCLQRREPHAGVHRAFVQILKDDLGVMWMAALGRPAIWQLIHARSTEAQDLGGFLLYVKVQEGAPWLAAFTTNELVKLSNHEFKQVRDAAQTIFVRNIDRYRAATNPAGCQEELAQAVRLLDAQWEDARQFYFAAFAEHFTAEEFTPGLLVSICDSVRPDVQQFGRDLITRYFADADGQEYLLKLSEHPTTDLQLFATNYLERYAAGDATRLRELLPFFISVLARVNRARVAKSRVLAFLAAEAHKSAEAAAVVAEILTRQSVTMAIGDKAATIETMLAIHRAYPTIDLPLQVQPITARAQA